MAKAQTAPNHKPDKPIRITKLMELVAELAVALGVRNINALESCWVHQFDTHWLIAANGHKEYKIFASQHGPINVPPFSVWVEFNGWPAGVFDAHGGTFAAGAAANEQTFSAALRSAIDAAKRKAT
jgi:hypothetical protein